MDLVALDSDDEDAPGQEPMMLEDGDGEADSPGLGVGASDSSSPQGNDDADDNEGDGEGNDDGDGDGDGEGSDSDDMMETEPSQLGPSRPPPEPPQRQSESSKQDSNVKLNGEEDDDDEEEEEDQGNLNDKERDRRRRAPENDQDDSPPSSTTSSKSSSLQAYNTAVLHRRSLYQTPKITITAQPRSYTIESIFTIPNGTPIHALAVPPCSSHILSGGQDGFIRRYGFHAMLNGTGVDNPSFNNLTMKQGGHQPATGVDVRLPVLVSYWENEEPGSWIDTLKIDPTHTHPHSPKHHPQGEEMSSLVNNNNQTDNNDIKWGPKNGALSSSSGQSPVHSLAVQSEEIFGLSGTALGSINLFTIRHDEGQIRHVFKSSNEKVGEGHKSTAPVSALTLGDEETTLLSGGWDSRIIEWDLNTGAATRNYVGNTGQISTIAYRPIATRNLDSTKLNGSDGATNDKDSIEDDVIMDDATNANAADGVTVELAAVSPASSSSSSTGVAAALVSQHQSVIGNATEAVASKVAPLPVANGTAVTSSTATELNGENNGRLGVGGETSLAGAAVETGDPSLTAPSGESKSDEKAGEGSEVDADGEEIEEDVLLATSTATATPFPLPTTVNGTPMVGGNSKKDSKALGPPPPKYVPIPTTLPSKNVAINVPVVGAPSSSALPELSNDVFMTSSIDGQVMIWDRRVKSTEIGGVRRFDTGTHTTSKGGTVSWCSSACWSPNGQQVFVGRRSSIVEIYDLRHSTPSTPVLQTLRLPLSSGAVSSVCSLPSGKHLISASHDNLRVWDLELALLSSGSAGGVQGIVGAMADREKKGLMAFKVISGHHGGMTSVLHVDPLGRYLIAASGNRGWDGTSTDNIVVHEIKAIY